MQPPFSEREGKLWDKTPAQREIFILHRKRGEEHNFGKRGGRPLRRNLSDWPAMQRTIERPEKRKKKTKNDTAENPVTPSTVCF